MLYATTRNNCDTYPASKVLRENRGADGGMYLPFQPPDLSDIEGSMNGCIAQVLNRLFQTRLTAWDVDFAVGRYPVRLKTLRQRIIMAEPWHNPAWCFESMVKKLVTLLAGEGEKPGDWTRIALRTAVLTGIFAQLKSSGICEPVDISVLSGDFSAVISAWYARAWGLPVGNIICCCNENNFLWDLLSHGQLRTDAAAVSTCVPEADVVVPTDLERLIYECGGPEEVDYYLECCRRGRMYCPEESVLACLREGLTASVVSSQRIEQTILGAYTTHDYLLSPASALAYAGLLDHRAKTGNIRPALVLTERSPLFDLPFVSKAVGISEETLKQIL